MPRFRQLWVLKEAYLKMLGVGLAGGLNCSSAASRRRRSSRASPAAGAVPQLALLAGSGCYFGVASADVTPFALNIECWAPVDHPDALQRVKVIARTE